MQLGDKNWNETILQAASELDFNTSPEVLAQFSSYAQELVKWNQKKNLTAITDPLEIAIKHFIDSLAPLSTIPVHANLLDMGSGAGFPGIVIKLAAPSLQVTLIDASLKKTNFQKHIIRVLGLSNIRAIHERVEEYSQNKSTRNRYDCVISRAFSDLEFFVRSGISILKKNGQLIAMKGKVPESEVKKLREQNYICQVHKYSLPVFKDDRSLVLIKRK